MMSIPSVDTTSYVFTIDGLVESPCFLSYADLVAMPSAEYRCYSACNYHPLKLSQPHNYQGVILSSLIEACRPKIGASHVRLHALDRYRTVVTLAALEHPRALLALGMDDKPLSREQGFPVRLAVPIWSAHRLPRWLTRMEFISTNNSVEGLPLLQSMVHFTSPRIVQRGAMISITGLALSSSSIEGVALSLDGGEWLWADVLNDSRAGNGVKWSFNWRFMFTGQYHIRARLWGNSGRPSNFKTFPAFVLNVVDTLP